MSRIVGKLIMRIDNKVPISADGPWSVSRDIPNYYSYGMLGYNGVGIGTMENVSGNCQFVIPATGLEVQLYSMQVAPFVVDWPMGDPALGVLRYKAIDCLFGQLNLQVDAPNGRTIVSAPWKAGVLLYPGKPPV